MFSHRSTNTSPRRALTRIIPRVVALAAMLCGSVACLAATAPTTPPVRHIFIIMLENESYAVTFGHNSQAPYLAQDLPKQGAMLPNYYGIGHNSLDNYTAMISGQAPNPAAQDDCTVYTEFVPTTTKPNANDQWPGNGCVYPKNVLTLANQLTTAGFSWRAYMEDMGADPSRESATCGHVAIGANDPTHKATPKDQYAAKHNPFVYFHSIIDDTKYCNSHVVNLNALTDDIASIETTPNFVYITPNLCNDGHDSPCVYDPSTGKSTGPGGLVSVNDFLRTWVPRILNSPAYKKDGLLIITFDEGTDAAMCCNEKGLPGGPKPGQYGPGGGQVGAVMLSPFIAPGTQSTVEYNHYSLLRTIEDIFGLSHLGYAGDNQLHTLGSGVFTAHPASSK